MMPSLELIDQEWMRLMNRVVRGLVHRTPEQWRVIHCFVRSRGEGEARQLAYAITCPDFPAQGTDKPGSEVHDAVCDLIRYYTRGDKPFAGMRIIVEIQPDNSLKNRFALVPAPEGTWSTTA
jgi:hypothetical protein